MVISGEHKTSTMLKKTSYTEIENNISSCSMFNVIIILNSPIIVYTKSSG